MGPTSATYLVPLPTPELFGKNQFTLALTDAGVITKLEYGTTSGAADAIGTATALAKALQKYARDNAAFTFKAGMVEGRVIDVAAINDLASMPPKEEIYAKLLYLINANATRVVSSIAGVGRNLAVVLDQAGKEGKFQG